ncbi:MAG: DUF1552 domain-containing protein [Planctomycetia bacterium]|nr:DUF1552 domain-containing protein [Planctomycetia bacterium]
MREPISRRTMLKGVTASIALPFLEGMLPGGVMASAAETVKAPLRMAFVYVPNGIHMEDWTPHSEGANYELTPSLAKLAEFKNDFSVLSGLTCDKARANGDGPGDHARAMSAFLTGSQPKKTAGADIRIGMSVDQVAASQLGHHTKLPSLEIGCDKGMNAGNCDSGYSCAYSNNLSWRSEQTPMPKEVDPKQLFERLYGTPKNHDERRSVLDAVLHDAHSLEKQLGGSDKRKLDEYLTSIREMESRLNRNKQENAKIKVPTEKPTGIPKEYSDHMKALADLQVLAFQADITRFSTFVFANEGSNRSYKFIGVPEGHHDLSHHGGDKAKHEKIAKINQFHLEHLAYLIGKLKSVKEGNGTLLDNMMLLYGSGIGDGNRHNHDQLPILLFGKAGGSLNPGRHVKYAFNTPITNLYVAMLQRLGIQQKRFGDSNGVLGEL